MTQSKLVQMLVGLDKKEWKRLEDLVYSPYFNKQKKCITLFDLLKQGILYQQDEYLKKAFIIEKIFITYHVHKVDNHLRVITNALTQLVEEFFIQEKLKTQTHYKSYLLHNVFLDRELFTHYISSYKKSKKNSLTSITRKGREDYFERYLQTLNESKYHQIAKERNTKTHVLEQTIEALNQYYWVNRLAITLELLSLKQVSKSNLSYLKIEELQQLPPLFSTDEHELFPIYYSAVLMLNNPENKAHLINLKQQLNQYNHIISKKELNHLYTLLINQLIRKNHHGENQFQQVFELYQLMDKQDILIEEEFITLSKFKNIVTLGCLLKQFDWTIQFIENYKLKLAPQHRKSAYAFNMGFLYFFQKKYDLAQEFLLTVTHLDVFYTMDTKSLLIQIYYETEQLQAVQYMLNPFRDFLRRQKKFNTNIKKGYLNFIKMLTLILKTRQNYGNKKVAQDKLLLKLDSYEVIHRKEWLKEKIKILETNMKSNKKV